MIKYQIPEDWDIPSLSEQKKEIMQNFNFELVEMIMRIPTRSEYDSAGELMGVYRPWKMWCDTFKNPTVVDLKKLADKLLSDVIRNYLSLKSPFISIRTGPFKVICRYGVLELMFVMEEWHCD